MFVARHQNIDLKLTPYIIMPTSYEDEGNGGPTATQCFSLSTLCRECRGMTLVHSIGQAWSRWSRTRRT